jgi:hypothetical protein
MKQQAAIDKNVMLEGEESDDDFPDDPTEFVRQFADKGGLGAVLMACKRLQYLQIKRDEKINMLR